MWSPFRKKSAEEYILQIIRIAKDVKTEFSSMQTMYKTKNIIRLLTLIKKFDMEQFRRIKEETKSKRLMQECLLIYNLTEEALKDINEEYTFEKAEQVVDKILSLEDYLLKDFREEIKFISSKTLNKILEYSPKDAIAKGYLFRGVSQEDYERLMRGQDIFARNPQGSVSILQHILDPTNNPNTQFISLTADSAKARHFGGRYVLVLDVRKLRGHLMEPREIEARVKDSRATRLVRKNWEFMLAPTSISFACIPADAVVH